jgi:hypothetical protein
MKKCWLLLMVLLVGFNMFSQSIEPELPILSPQSPTTNELGKYGEIQVNESTGKISPSIPLFEYYAGKINLPIALQYNGNGVRVNQDPTWVGINWNLNPGGVITRVVKDRVDELTTRVNRKYFSEEDLDNLQGVKKILPNTNVLDPNTVWFKTISSFSDGAVDTEADIFNYNFLGYSGSFYLDIDNKVHLIKYDKELSITFNFIGGNKSQIHIKTPEGDSYFFGVDASESSRTWLNIGSGSTANIDPAQNAFYLYQISYLNGGSINFTYESFKTTCDVTKIGIQESITKSATSSCTKTTRTLYSDVERLVKLKKISSSFNDQYVEFDISSYGECSRMHKLNNVFLKSSTGQTLKKVKLNYLTINKEVNPLENKFYLDKVEFFNKNNVFEYDYELTYNSPELLPSKDSFSQDELGFYNGIANITLLPKTSNAMLNKSCYNLANREAHLQYSQYGSLSKIKYPTGGYSTFEYELPYKGKETVYVDNFVSAYYRDPARNNSSSNYVFNSSTQLNTYSSTYYPDGDGPLVIASSTPITISLNITAMGSFTHHNNVLVSVIRVPGGQVVWTNAPGGNNGPIGYPLVTTDNVIKEYRSDYSCNLSAGSYIFKVFVNLHSSVSTSNYVVANVQLKLPDPSPRTVFHSGLRIKRIKSADNNSNIQTTRYYYNSLNKRDLESYQFFPNYISVTLGHNKGDKITDPLVNFYNLSANSVKSSFNMDQQVYDYVTLSYGGDNFENGGKQMSFHKQSDYPPRDYITSPVYQYNASDYSFSNYVDAASNDSYQNSTLREEIYYNANLDPVKKLKYNYSGSLAASANNIKLYKFVPESNYSLDHTIYLLYKTGSYKYRLISTDETDYFDDGIKEVATNTTKSYNPDKVSLPSSIEIKNSLNEIKRTNIYYASDIALIRNLSSDDILNINLLQTKHNVSEIIKTENLLNGSILKTNQVFFKNWRGLILPSTIKDSKALGVLEERVVFHDYNFYGKPTIVSLKDGPKTGYSYNSKQQVVLKIENYDSSFIIDDQLIISDPCYYQTLYPLSMVTKYNYDAITNNLKSIVDPRCNTTYYDYDEFNRLKLVKDNAGNILSENEYKYKQ